MKTVMVTGYRAHELGIFSQKHKGIPYIRKAIENKLVPLLEEGLEWVITPGQYGVDLWACEAAIGLKDRYPGLKVSVITAFANQEEEWKEDKQSYYRNLLAKVDYYAPVSKSPYEGPWQFQARDELLLRKSDGLVLVYDEDAAAGSPRFLKEKARKRAERDGYPILTVTSEDIQSIADEETAFDDFQDGHF